MYLNRDRQLTVSTADTRFLLNDPLSVWIIVNRINEIHQLAIVGTEKQVKQVNLYTEAAAIRQLTSNPHSEHRRGRRNDYTICSNNVKVELPTTT